MECSFAVNANDAGVADLRLLIAVLVTVKKVAGLGPDNVFLQAPEALVNLGVAFMDPEGGIVSHKYIHFRELSEHSADFFLLVEVGSFGFVLPASIEPAEAEAVIVNDIEMKRGYTWRKGPVRVMVAFHGQGFLTRIADKGFLKREIREVPQTQEYVCGGVREMTDKVVIICEDYGPEEARLDHQRSFVRFG